MTSLRVIRQDGDGNHMFSATFKPIQRGPNLYYTRPKLTSLGLDLEEISGGGGMPSQFEGRTTDGRPVYIRYRGGQLSVRCGDVGYAGSIYDVEPLLDASIGPPFDGYIDLEQACELTGITLKGKPFEHSPTSGPRDWTGHTTYWERHVKMTRQGAQVFVEALAEWLGVPTLLEGEWTGLDRGQQPSSRFVRRADLNACKSYVILCFNPIDDNYESLLGDRQPAWPIIKACFDLTIRLQFGFRGEIKSNAGFPAFFREKRPNIQFLTGIDGSVSTEFSSDDKERRSTVERVVDVVARKFSNMLEKIGLETGQATPLDWFWYSIDLYQPAWVVTREGFPTGSGFDSIISAAIRRWEASDGNGTDDHTDGAFSGGASCFRG